MLFTTEGTMRMLRLAVVAALGLARLGIAQGEILNENNEDSTTTTTSTSTITITTLITSTVTCTSTRGATTCVGPTADLDITSGAVPSTETTSSSTVGTTSSLAAASTNLVSPPDMTTQGKKYVLQGCFAAQDGADGIGQVLGQNYMTPEATDMSLSLCLQECASVVTEGSIATYPYAGVADGSSCYCGTTLNATAPRSNIDECTLPCAGSNTEACGGHGYMSVYKLDDSSETTGQTTVTVSSHASSPSASQTAGTHSSGAAFTENRDMDTSGAKSPGTIAGITIGSVSGVGMLLLLIFIAARWLIRRRQLHAASAAHAPQKDEKTKKLPHAHSVGSVGTTSATVNTHDAASIRDAMRVDLRRLDGVVMDQQSPAAARFSFARSSDKEFAVEKIGVAATTGAEWKSAAGASPLTPRTPRYAGVDGVEDEKDRQQLLLQPRPSTPTIVVHPPDNIAPNHGLGERAWHRRRLSMEYAAPPTVVEAVAVVDDRRALPSQQSHSVAEEGIEEQSVSAMTGEGPVVQSPSWQWTLSSMTEEESEKTEKQA